MATLSIRVVPDVETDPSEWNWHFIGCDGRILWSGEGNYPSDFAAVKAARKVRRRFEENQRLVDECQF